MTDSTPRMQFWTKRHDRALEDMVRQQWMSPPAHPLRVLQHLAKLGYAYQCGRIFYPTPEGRAREKFGRELRQSPQAELNLDPVEYRQAAARDRGRDRPGNHGSDAMSKYTAEQVEAMVEQLNIVNIASTEHKASEMLRDYAALLREREAAKAGVTDALDYVPGELDKTAPDRIWLQIDTAASNNDREEPWTRCDDVTWQDDSVGGLEIQYARADLIAPMLASAPISDEKLLNGCLIAMQTAQYQQASARVPEDGFFASGPEGEFISHDHAFAEKLISLSGFNRNEWTVTDLAAAPKRGEW